ncbi:Hypothetical protein LUCI_0824 [Lucifera butyrica]|uniref:IrrE N-terminal-like domain-containing protein n=1 Tax=Lucifera butyrica TaxID=1351585 RepID=A0A498R2B9_9FIRM|nr:hypothetical protein [Lucifera butyrica]VBB05614.1 Hypothetical protein LUCI_0824 [Lucifera butyrica]
MNLRKINNMVSTGELLFHKVKLIGNPHGFVYKSRKGRTHIFIDSSLSLEAERDTLLHECCHVSEHMNDNSYAIGLDDRHHEREEEAEEFVRKNKRVNFKDQLWIWVISSPSLLLNLFDVGNDWINNGI